MNEKGAPGMTSNLGDHFGRPREGGSSISGRDNSGQVFLFEVSPVQSGREGALCSLAAVGPSSYDDRGQDFPIPKNDSLSRYRTNIDSRNNHRLATLVIHF
jgi:hypothetical protein